jgi:glycosyltransferase involved in cell wall biosynthesis
MRLVFLCIEPAWTGPSRVFATVAHELTGRGYETTLVVSEGSEVARFAERFQAELVRVPLHATVWGRDRAALRALAGGRPPEAVFVHSDAEHLIAARLVKRLGARGGARGVVRRIPAGGRPPTSRGTRRAERLSPTRYLYTSESPPSGHATPPGTLSPVRAELGVTIPFNPAAEQPSPGPPGAVWLACISTRSAIRRATNVVRAVALLAQRQTNLHLRVIGSAASDPDLQVLASALGIGKRVTWDPNPATYATALQGVAAGWVVADGDDAGLGVLQLMANGVAVLAEKTAVSARYVSHGIHGALFATLEPPLMAAETTVLLADRERRVMMGQAGRARVEREFTAREMLAGFEQAVRATRDRRTPVG